MGKGDIRGDMETGKYDALDVSKHIIEYGYKIRSLVTNLRLQKLLYFVQAEHLAREEKPCFFNRIEAWRWGPVVPDVYRNYAIFGSMAIPVVVDELPPVEENVRRLMESVSNHFKKYFAWDLVDITHGNGPWKMCYGNSECSEITPQVILDYIKSSNGK